MFKFALVSAALVLATLSSAFAHQTIEVGDDYVFICGKQNEPTFTGMPSGLELFIETPGGEPVEGAAQGLSVELTSPTGTIVTYTPDGGYGPRSFFEASWKGAGTYNTTWILQTPGQYTVHITGFVGETEIDVTCDDEDTWVVEDRSAIEVN